MGATFEGPKSGCGLGWVWKPRFPTPLVWDRFREGWFGGGMPSWLPRTSWLAGWHREGVLGPCQDGRPGRVWTPSWTGLGATLPGPSKVDFSSKDGGTPSFEGLGTLRAFFPRKPTQGPKSRLFLEFLDSWFRTVWTGPRAVQTELPTPPS